MHTDIREIKSAATVAFLGVLAIIGVALIVYSEVRCYLYRARRNIGLASRAWRAQGQLSRAQRLCHMTLY